MRSVCWLAVATVVGCAADPLAEDGDDDTPLPDRVIATGVEEPPPPPPATCPVAAPGAELWAQAIGVGGLGLTSSASIIDDGDVIITKSILQVAPTFGVERHRGEDGVAMWGWPYGALAAVGLDGFVYATAPFAQPFDFGFGTVEPAGGRDVIVAKLDPLGVAVFARALRLPAERLVGFAVAADGRLAVSGVGIGTLVLDAEATLLFQHPLVGDVAFDAAGDLVIAGAFAGSLDAGDGHAFCTEGDLDALVVKLDPTGCVRWAVRLGDPTLPVMLGGSAGYALTTRTLQAATAVAIDAAGNILVAGEAPYAADLLGDVLVSSVEDAGLAPSGFVVKLAPDGGLLWSEHLQPVAIVTDLAVDQAGNAFVSGAQPATFGPSGLAPMLVALSPLGDVRFSQGAASEGAGYALAADACGDVIQIVTERPLPFVDWQASLYKRAF